MSVLILGTREDIHVDLVCRRFDANGIEHYVLDHKRNEPFDATFHNDGAFEVQISGSDSPFEPDTIWYRSKVRRISTVNNEITRNEFIVNSEWISFYDEVSYLNYRTVNPLESIRKCSFKMNQQALAQTLGFYTPDSIITTDKNAALKFARKYQSVIVKKIGTGGAPAVGDIPAEALMTTIATIEDITQADHQSFLSCPSLFQQQIEKEFEIRAVVVGSDIYAFKIDSQAREETRTDWRYGNDYLRFDPITLDEKVNCLLISFLKQMNLFTGVFDIVVDIEGQYWFLECNPDGQWAWLDEQADSNISSSFANLLSARQDGARLSDAIKTVEVRA